MRTRYERLQSVSLAIILTVGAAVVWGVVSGLSLALVENVFFSHDVPTVQLRVLSDGTPVVEEYHGQDYPTTYRTLDGKPLDLGRLQFADNWSFLCGASGWISPRGALTWGQRIYRLESSPVNWFLIHDAAPGGRACLVGYDRITKLKAGYIGRGGFRADEPPPEERFAVDARRWPRGSGFPSVYGPDASACVYLVTNNGLVRIDLAKASVVTLWNGSDLIAADTWRPSASNDPRRVDHAAPPAILVRTPERIVVLDENGKQLAAYPLPAELRDRYLRCHPLADSKLLLCGPEWPAGGNELYWIDTAGRLVRHERINPPERPSFPVARESIFMTITMPSAATLAGFIALDASGRADYSIVLGKTLARRWPELAMAAVVGLVLAVLCFRRQRSYGLGGTWFWTPFVLLFGVPAYFGYLAHRSWAARLPCPSCQQPVPRDRPACFSCGQEFPSPAAKGIEVFA